MSRPNSAVPTNVAAAQLLSAFSINSAQQQQQRQQRQQQQQQQPPQPQFNHQLNHWDSDHDPRYHRQPQQHRLDQYHQSHGQWSEEPRDIAGPPPPPTPGYEQHQSLEQDPEMSMELPFGYSFDIPDEELLNQPPPPPEGNAALLSDTETRMLSSFFDSVQTSDFVGNTWGEGLPINSGDWSLNESLLELPPYDVFGAEMSSSSNLENGNSLQNVNSNENTHQPPPTPVRQTIPTPSNHLQQSLSQAHDLANAIAPESSLEDAHEIYEAAATLFHNSQGMAIADSQSFMSRLDTMRDPRSNDSNGNDIFNGTHQRQQHPNHTQSISGPSYNHSVMQRASASRRSLPMNIEWGTDSSFATGSGYIPASDNEASHMLHQQQQAVVGQWFNVNNSGTTTGVNTRAPSPNHQHRPQHHLPEYQTPDDRNPASPKRNRVAEPVRTIGEETESESETVRAPATKRRKSTHTRDKLDQAINGTNGLETTHPEESTTDKPTDKQQLPDTSPPLKLRRSRANTKEPRRNLTEAQKRENHIVSEQRRRTQIKVGFSELMEMVPGLKGGGFSKSAILSVTCQFLKDLEDGNRVLEGQLKGLNGE